MAKERLDVLLVERGLVGRRGRERTMIMEGRVHGDRKQVEKAGTVVEPESGLSSVVEDVPR